MATLHSRFHHLQNFIMQNPQRPFSVAELAGQAHISPYHFHRLFSAFVGESVHQYVQRQRLEKAASYLLHQPHRSITDIAVSLQFSSSANFSRAFANHFQCSPSAYRRSPCPAQNRKIGKVLIQPLSYAVELKHCAPVRLAYIRRQSQGNSQQIANQFAQLNTWAQRHEVAPGALYGVTWFDSHITQSTHWLYDAAMEVNTTAKECPPVFMQSLPGGQFSILKSQLRHSQFDTGFQQLWDHLVLDWLPTSGFEPADQPAYERYFPVAADVYEVHLCLPICGTNDSPQQRNKP